MDDQDFEKTLDEYFTARYRKEKNTIKPLEKKLLDAAEENVTRYYALYAPSFSGSYQKIVKEKILENAQAIGHDRMIQKYGRALINRDRRFANDIAEIIINKFPVSDEELLSYISELYNKTLFYNDKKSQKRILKYASQLSEDMKKDFYSKIAKEE